MNYFTSFLSVVGVACAAAGPSLFLLLHESSPATKINYLFIYYSTPTMDRPPSPAPGPRIRAKMARTPSHRTATPRATSGSHTPPRAGKYDPLRAATNLDSDNPFHGDSADEDSELGEGSPALLTNPAGVDATVTVTEAAVADASGGSGVVSGDNSNTVVTNPPP